MSKKLLADFLVDGIGRLYTCHRPGDENGPRRGEGLKDVGLIEDAAVAAYQGEIVAVGSSDTVRAGILVLPGAESIDAQGRAVVPGFVDAHTHAVFGKARPDEFGRRLVGESYQSIAESGGGIRASVRDFRQRKEDDLVALTRSRLKECLRNGSTTVEVKSGYGLELESELKALRVVKALKGEVGLPRLVATCLAAHEFPDEYRERREEYLELVLETILPEVARQGLAERVDVFCEPGVYTREQAHRVLTKGQSLGMAACIHADELEGGGGTELAVEITALSADHLGAISKAGIKALADSGTVGVLLPGTIFSLGLDKFAPARELIEAGAALALATDFNPGSNYCSSIPLTLTIACTRMHLHPHEGLLMATLNAAWSLGRAATVGSLVTSKRCDLLVLEGDSLDEMVQHLGGRAVACVVRNGQIVS